MGDWYTFWVAISVLSLIYHFSTKPFFKSVKIVMLGLVARVKNILLFVFEGPLVPIIALIAATVYFSQ